LSRLASRVPRRPVATLSEWMSLQHEVASRRTAETRSRRDAKEREEEARRSGRLRRKAAAAVPADDEESEKLSPLMEAAVMNGVNGKATAAEIARRVCAEALSAGWWYYGKTTLALVEKFLEKQHKDGLIVW